MGPLQNQDGCILIDKLKNMNNIAKFDMKFSFKIIIVFLVFLTENHAFAQQDPQFTQYMYNTLSVNSAYAGSRRHIAITGIHRTQWVGLEGAPESQTFSFDTPVSEKIGLGLSIVNDKIGPLSETYFDTNFSYSIRASDHYKLSFGLKGGLRLFDIDWSRGLDLSGNDPLLQNNINRLLPTVGAGVYLHSEKAYIGVSVPNFFTEQHYDAIQQSLAAERIHIFLIGGLVFDLSKNAKFKPAFLFKHVTGAPIIFDLSANFMFHEKLRLGASYRWDDSFGGLVGFNISPKLLIGYAYDYTTTDLRLVNNGSHELMLLFQLISKTNKLKSPRFF